MLHHLSPLTTGLCCIALYALIGGGGRAQDFWASPTAPGVVTNNDCAVVSGVFGIPIIHRSFMTGSERSRMSVADRLVSGDEIFPANEARVEATAGNNILVAFGPDTRARMGGLHTITGEDGSQILRLDVRLFSGRCRLQVRLNSHDPEAVLVSVDGADILLKRGDLAIVVDNGWRVAVLSGEAHIRDRKGGTAGIPRVVSAGTIVTSDGEQPLEQEERDKLADRLPFTFEVTRTALPPLPAMSYILEAP